MKWNKEQIALIASKYEYKRDFRKENENAYQEAYKKGYLEEICNHMSKKSNKEAGICKRSKHLDYKPGTYEYRRSTYLKHKYNITYKEYLEKLESQNNCCAICNNIVDSSKILHVDHCHTTGKIRGLLCFDCNTALGKFKDNKDRLDRAIKYLEKFS